MPTVNDIIDVIERFAPPAIQESWDNTGLQVGHRDMPVTGVMTCVDVTPQRVDEAIKNGLNMIVSHHPLLFRGLKSITGDSGVQRAVEMALVHGIAVYSSHTATDSTVGGISALMAEKLGAHVVAPLQPTAPGSTTGLGVMAELNASVTPREFVALTKTAFGNTVVRTTDPDLAPSTIKRIALLGGAGDDMITKAIEAGALAYVTGELRYHHFVDYANYILLVDCGHYETEQSAKTKFAQLISQQYPSLKVITSQYEINPVKYI